MVTRYTQQFLRQVEWGELDFLVLDLPPGTGDIQLTIVQTVALAGAVIVTTPQEVALIDARKAATMFAEGERARARAHRKHELLPLPERREALRHLRQRRRRARSGAAARCRCSARFRSTSPRANPATAACRSPPPTPKARWPRRFSRSPGACGKARVAHARIARIAETERDTVKEIDVAAVFRTVT